MKKTVRLTENDLTRLVKQVMKENNGRIKVLSKYDSSKTLSEQVDDFNNSIAKEIHASVSGPGTNTKKFENGVLKIKSAQQFNQVDSTLKSLYSNLGIEGWINDDMGGSNLPTVDIVSKHLKSIGINNSYETKDTLDANSKPIKAFKDNSFRILSSAVAAPDAATTDPWTKFPCVTGAKGTVKANLKDGSFAYKLNNVFYYNNGRKKLADGKMSNYTCNDPEFKTVTGGNARNKQVPSVQSRVQKVQTQLGIEGGTGQLDMVTLQKMIDKLSATTTPATPATPTTDNKQLTQLSQQINALNQAQA